MLAGIVGGAGYLVWDNYAPKSLKKAARKHVKKDEISAPVGTTTATTTSKALEQEWLPAGIRKKAAAKKTEGVASSGDESPASGTEKRKARKAAAATAASK